MAAESVSIKFVHGDVLRRVSLASDVTWDDFAATIQNVFGLPVGRLTLQYRDTDGDLVTVTSAPELRELISQAATGTAAQRVIVESTVEAAPAPAQDKSDWEIVSDSASAAASASTSSAASTASAITDVEDVDDKHEPAESTEATSEVKAAEPAKADAKPAETETGNKRKRSPFTSLFETLRNELDAFANAVIEEANKQKEAKKDSQEQQQQSEEQESAEDNDEDEDEDEDEVDNDEVEWVRRSLIARLHAAQLYDHYRLRAIEAERERRRRLALAQHFYYSQPAYTTRYVLASPSTCRGGYCW